MADDCLEYEDVYGNVILDEPAWNGSAYSNSVLTGNGVFAVRVSPTAAGVVVGLSHEPAGSEYIGITHGVIFQSGAFQIIESGSIKTAPATFRATDTFYFYRYGGEVVYLRKRAGEEYGGPLPGSIIYTSTVPSFGSAYLDSSLWATGDRILEAAVWDYAEGFVALYLDAFGAEHGAEDGFVGLVFSVSAVENRVDGIGSEDGFIELILSPGGVEDRIGDADASGFVGLILDVNAVEYGTGTGAIALILDPIGFETEGAAGLVGLVLDPTGREEIQPLVSRGAVPLIISPQGVEFAITESTGEVGLILDVNAAEPGGGPEIVLVGLVLSPSGVEDRTTGMDEDGFAGLVLAPSGVENRTIGYEFGETQLVLAVGGFGLSSHLANRFQITLKLTGEQSLSEFAPVKLFPGYRREFGRVVIPLSDLAELSATEAGNESGSAALIMRALLLALHEYVESLPLEDDIATISTWVMESETLSAVSGNDMRANRARVTRTRNGFVIDFDTETML